MTPPTNRRDRRDRRPSAGTPLHRPRLLVALVTAALLLAAGSASAPTPPASAAPLFTVVSPPPPVAWLGQPYAHTFRGEPAGATWSVTGGALPEGLSLDAATGELHGTPTATGTSGPITVRGTWPGTATAVAAGGDHSCALTGTGAVDCWGDDAAGQATDQTGPLRSLAAGGAHTCALTPGGAAECWGSNAFGQAVDKPGPYTAIAAGGQHTCALRPNGSADCWGYDRNGQATDKPGPFTAVAAGGQHTCALTPAGAAECWGRDGWGQAADQPGPYVTISAGGQHTCALTPAGAADCWGYDLDGQATDRPGPYTALAAGGFHTCGLTSTGAADCWGHDLYGQAADRPGPYAAVTAGSVHTCALTPSGAVECWGADDAGQATDRPETATAEQTVTITVAAPHITSDPPSPAAWGTPYRHTFAGTPSSATWTLADGTLPDGLTLDPATGELTGTPTEIGTFGPVTVAATWPGPLNDAQTFSLTIEPPVISSGLPPDTTWGAPYRHTFAGAPSGATWSVADGTLPDGLSLDPATGELTGTPTEIGTFGPVTVQATWPGPLTDAQTFSLTVAPRPPRSLSGTVTADHTGEPAAGVTVTLVQANPSWVIVATAVTDAAGEYAFADLPDGEYQLRFFDGHARFQRTWYASRGTYRTASVVSVVGGAPVVANQVLRPLEGQWITGRVHLGDGRVAPGVIVLVHHVTNGFYGSARTGSDGYFVLWGIPNGRYRVQLVDPTAPTTTREWYQDEAYAANADLVVVGGGGTVIHATIGP